MTASKRKVLRRAEFTSLVAERIEIRSTFVVAVLILVALEGCSRPKPPEPEPAPVPGTSPNVTDASPVAAPEPTPPAPAEPPLTQRLAEQLLALKDLQQKRQNLLLDFKVELAQLAADLKTGIRRQGLELDQALQQLKQPPPQGPLAELALKYRRCAALQVSIQRLKDMIDSDQVRLGKLEFAEANLRQQERLEGVSIPADREKAEKLLEEVEEQDQFNPEDILENPALAKELDDAFQNVQQNLQHRVSLLPARTEKSLDELAKLPALDFPAQSLAERTLLDALREHLAAGQTEAARLLTAAQPESAILALHECLGKVRFDLEKFGEPLTWKADCLQQLDQTQSALSEQLAGPYLTAIENAVPEARKKQDWSPVLDLLEEVLRLAPKAAKLPDLIREIDVLLQWRESAGDLEAAVARKRFELLRQQVLPGTAYKPPLVTLAKPSSKPSLPAVTPNAAAPPPTPVSRVAPGEIDFAAWQRAHEALHAASRGYLGLEAELKAILVDYQATAPKAQQKQAELNQQREVVAAALADQDRAEQDVFGQYARLIAKRQQAYEHLTKTLGMKTTAQEPWRVERQIAGLRTEQQPYAAGNERAGGRGPAIDLVAVARRAGFTGLKPGDPFVLAYQGVAIPLRWCPPGSFRMGSPTSESGRSENEAQVEVTHSAGFWMAETETTQQLWQAAMGVSLRQQASTAGTSSSLYGEGPNHPMYYVNYDEATAFCRKLSDHFTEAGTLPDGWQIMLPTEAQWEYACRAGATTAFNFGSDESQLEQYAWFDKNAAGATHPVAQKKPNTWGLCDMHGNLWEWCRDGYQDRLPGGVDPVVAQAASARVYRGGSWCYAAAYCRSAYRSRGSPSYRSNYLGFRLAAVQSPR